MNQANNARMQNLQVQLAYDQQRLNVRASMLELALKARQTVTAGSTAAGFTASDLVGDAKMMEAYIFEGISKPGEVPAIVQARTFPG